MTEILTESFCERCGTRYTFESARPKTRLKSVKVLSRGLKNFVLSDDTSIDEAMAAARSEADREATAHQLDAFHKTFNFCMSCRQYTCPNCWNEAEVRCLSCAPLALPEPPVRLEDLAAFRDAALMGESAVGNGATAHEDDGEPEPAAAEQRVEQPSAAAAGEIEAAAPVDVEETIQPLVQAEAVEAAGPDMTAEEPAPSAAADEALPVVRDPAGKAAAQTTGLLRRFRPGQSLDAELDAFERERSDAAPSGTPADATEATALLEAPAADVEAPAEETRESVEVAPVQAEEAADEAVEAAPTPVAAEPPEPAAEVAPEPTPEPVASPEPEPQPLAAASDIVEQPTWRISAPDPGGAAPLPPSSEPAGSIPLQASGAQTNAPTAEPQWPARPQWPGSTPAAGLPFLGRPTAAQGGIEALWAASNQELVTAAPAPGRAVSSGIQPCVSCGLSLSATARFCRRCGTLQGR